MQIFLHSPKCPGTAVVCLRPLMAQSAYLIRPQHTSVTRLYSHTANFREVRIREIVYISDSAACGQVVSVYLPLFGSLRNVQHCQALTKNQVVINAVVYQPTIHFLKLFHGSLEPGRQPKETSVIGVIDDGLLFEFPDRIRSNIQHLHPGYSFTNHFLTINFHKIISSLSFRHRGSPAPNVLVIMIR